MIQNKSLWALCFVVISESTAAALLIPFIARFITLLVLGDYEACSSELKSRSNASCETIGYFAGLATSAYFLASFASGIFWAYVSDFIGRKTVLILSLLGNAVAAVFFGLSSSLWMIVLVRFTNGLFNGITGVSKVCVGELTDDETQSFGFSLRSTFYSAGLVVGPLLGGFLCEPHTTNLRFLAPHEDSFLAVYPYFLPSAVSCAISLTGVVFAFFFLGETLPPRTRKTAVVLTGLRRRWSSSSLVPSSSSVAADEPMEAFSDEEEDSEAAHKKRNWFSVLWVPDFLLCSLNYAALACVEMGLVEVFGLWSLFPPDSSGRGLGFKPSSIGVANAVSGVAMIFFTLFGYVPLDRRFGTRRVMFGSFLLLMALVVVFPLNWVFLFCLHFPFWLLFCCVCALFSLIRVTVTCGYSTTAITATNAVDRELFSASQGLSSSLALAARALAPLLAMSFFSFAISHPPLNFSVVFDAFGALCAASSVLSLFIVSTERKKAS